MNKTPTQGKSHPLTPFFIFWTGQALSLVGSILVQFVLIWWLTESSGSATVLAFASMMEVLPRIFISPIAGALVDRWNRRTIMIVADSLIALALIVLMILYALDAIQIWHIYVVLFLRAIGGAFHWPAMQASTTLMVPERHLARVAGMHQTLQGLMIIVAPPLGALLFSILPMEQVLAIDVVTALMAIGPLLFIRIPQPKSEKSRKIESKEIPVISELREGLNFMRGWTGLIIILVVAAIYNFLSNPAFTFVPLMVRNHFGGGAIQLGWVQSAFGVGVLVGGLTLSIWGGFKRRMVTVNLAFILGGLCFAIIGLLPENGILLAIGIAFFIGFFYPILNGSLMAVMQASVPPAMQGRVFTLLISVTGAVTPLGLMVAGPVGDTLGIPSWYLISGLMTVLMGAIMFFVPAAIRIEDYVNGEKNSKSN